MTKCLGSSFAEHCAAIHVNMVVARPPKGQSVKEFVASASQEDLVKLARVKWNGQWEFAYQEIQGTRPQTLGKGWIMCSRLCCCCCLNSSGQGMG